MEMLGIKMKVVTNDMQDEFGGWYDALKTDNDNCFATIEELEARIPGKQILNMDLILQYLHTSITVLLYYISLLFS